ncbi:Protein Njmu-R1 [Manis pentadactyla]|nr:Protein Njmu-R1 [Manis pentadactyla]
MKPLSAFGAKGIISGHAVGTSKVGVNSTQEAGPGRERELPEAAQQVYLIRGSRCVLQESTKRDGRPGQRDRGEALEQACGPWDKPPESHPIPESLT